ncbi:MAG: hypothetical protein Q3980_14885 [Turicibacter sp.]|nr:hypothetical protein [Turicibacter sp.]
MIVYEHIFNRGQLKINEVQVERKKKIDIGNYRGTLQTRINRDNYDIANFSPLYGWFMYSDKNRKDDFISMVINEYQDIHTRTIEEYELKINKQKEELKILASLL